MKKLMKKQRGITLIALVITIVILLILVGVTCIFTFDNNSLLKKADEARDAYQYEEARELLDFKIEEIEMQMWKDNSRPATLEDIIVALSDENEINITIKAYNTTAKVNLVSNGATDLNGVDHTSISNITIDVKNYLFTITHTKEISYIGKIRRKWSSYT